MLQAFNSLFFCSFFLLFYQFIPTESCRPSFGTVEPAYDEPAPLRDLIKSFVSFCDFGPGTVGLVFKAQLQVAANRWLKLEQTKIVLSKKTKYAINALVYIAKNREEQPISVSRISQEQTIPLKFLESILTELKNARILKSTKGKFGGYSLNGTPEEIHMAKIVRLFDGAIGLLPCVTYEFYERCEECVDEETCGIRQIAMEIRNNTVKRLKAATLADIIKREEKLRQ